MTNLISFTRKIDWLGDETTSKHGWGNGYVAVPKEHPFFGIDYNEIGAIVNVHGGLTYANEYQKWMPKEVEGMWIFGFDCTHYSDTLETCPKEYVEAETERLKEQLSRGDIKTVLVPTTEYFLKD